MDAENPPPRVTLRDVSKRLRLSLGATHARLFVQLMIESIAVSLLGGFFGLLLAYAGTRAFISLIPDTLPNPTLGLDRVTIDYRVLAFAVCRC